MKINHILLCIFISTLGLQAQNISDVVRWSSTDPTGTARTLGVGSAFGAMGGDFSVININPAGIADFRISEFTFTPSLRGYKTDSWFISDPNNNQLYKGNSLGLDNIGFVFASNPGSKWTSSNFAIGYSRISDLKRNVFIKGQTPGSITTRFKQLANNNSVEEITDINGSLIYDAGLAWYTYAINDYFENDSIKYETDFNDSLNILVDKSQDINMSGGVNELALSWAGEYNNQFNVGISVGIPFASYEEVKTYKEEDRDNRINLFEQLEYSEILSISGVGINFKTGFTYKITPQIRIGGAFHSPTWYRFTDNFSTSLTYENTTIGSTTEMSPENTFEYKISTPWRTVGSIGTTYRLGDIRGFVNADLEYLNYSNASYNGTAFSSNPEERDYTNEVNKEIQKSLGSATNLRIGTEFGYKSLRLRAGYSFEQAAFSDEQNKNNKTSFGIGFRDDKFFIDLGIRISQYAEGYNPYVVIGKNLDPLSNINTTRTRGALTLGFKF